MSDFNFGFPHPSVPGDKVRIKDLVTGVELLNADLAQISEELRTRNPEEVVIETQPGQVVIRLEGLEDMEELLRRSQQHLGMLDRFLFIGGSISPSQTTHYTCDLPKHTTPFTMSHKVVKPQRKCIGPTPHYFCKRHELEVCPCCGYDLV